MVSAILLAAGEARRMGRLKQLLPLGKTTVVEQSVDNLLHSRASEVIVVLGYRAEEIKKKLAARPVKLALNSTYSQGMSTSIVAGLSQVGDQARAVMLALADQPFIDSQTIDRLIDSFSGCNKGIVVPTYQGQRGHPVIFDIKYRDELLGLKGDTGGREIIGRYPEDVLEVAVDSPGINIDIDTADDYYSSL